MLSHMVHSLPARMAQMVDSEIFSPNIEFGSARTIDKRQLQQLQHPLPKMIPNYCITFDYMKNDWTNFTLLGLP